MMTDSSPTVRDGYRHKLQEPLPPLVAIASLVDARIKAVLPVATMRMNVGVTIETFGFLVTRLSTKYYYSNNKYAA